MIRDDATKLARTDPSRKTFFRYHHDTRNHGGGTHESMRFVLFLSILLTFILAATSVWATNPADATLAQALFTSGKDAMARGDLATACARFSESLKLDPGVGTLLNLATCEDRSGKLTVALEHFTSARTQLPKDDFRIAFATEKIANLSQRIAHITVRSAAPPGGQPGGRVGLRVLRDGVEVEPSAFNAPIPVDPGAHVIIVETSGQPPERTELTLREGEAQIVEVRAKTTSSAPSATSSSNKDGSNNTGSERASGDAGAAGTRRTFASITAGVAVAGLVTGAVTGLVAINAASTYRAHCTDGECDPDGLSAASTGRTVRIVSPFAFGVGTAFGIASVYLFLSGPKAKRRDLPAKSSVAMGARIAPTISWSGGGVSLVGNF